MQLTLLCTVILTTSTLLFGAQVTPISPTRLYQATIANDAALVEKLLTKGANCFDQSGATEAPIHAAARLKYCAIVKLLIWYEPTCINAIDNAGNTPLHVAVIAGDMPIIDYLLDQGANKEIVNNDNRYAEELITTLEIQNIFTTNEGRRKIYAAKAEEQCRKISALLQTTRSYNSTDGGTGQTPRSQARTGCGCIIC